MKSAIVWMLLALNASFAQAEIREITRMEDVRALVKPGTVVVFDIDNTILETAQTLGSDQWFEHRFEELRKQGLDASTATDRAIELWERIQLKSAVRPVEKTTPALIRELQEAGVPVMALTARPVTLAARTHDQLASAGVGFRWKPITRKKKIEGYVDGIVFVGPKLSKGEALKLFLGKIGAKPARVVFADDKKKHTQTVDAVMTAAGVETIALRYGAADAMVKAFDERIAERQLEAFETQGALISDEDAAMAPAVSETPYYRVFRGVKRPDLTDEEFRERLAERFIPATPETHAKNGLVAYLPALPLTALEGRVRKAFPDELAIVAYRSEETYKRARATPEGEKYAELHWEVFDRTASKTGPAVPYAGKIERDVPYDLIAKPVHWQKGFSSLTIFSRPKAASAEEFLASASEYADSLKKRDGLNGAIAAAGEDWFFVYANWSRAEQARESKGRQGLPASLVFLKSLAAEEFSGRAEAGKLYNVRFPLSRASRPSG